jgi:hypothetical protein
MACIHSLEHVQGGGITNFAYDNSIWTHTQGIHNQVANGNFTFTFDVRWTRFKGTT